MNYINYIKEGNPSFKEFLKEMLTMRFWVFMLTIAFLVISMNSIVSSTADWIIDKTALPEIIKGIFKFAVQLPIAFWIGKYPISRILHILFRVKYYLIFLLTRNFYMLRTFYTRVKVKKKFLNQ